MKLTYYCEDCKIEIEGSSKADFHRRVNDHSVIRVGEKLIG